MFERSLVFVGLLLISGCGFQYGMAPSERATSFDEGGADFEASRDPDLGTYTLDWDSTAGDEVSMILATTRPGTSMEGDDAIAVAVRPPYYWTPDDKDARYRFQILPTFASPFFINSDDVDEVGLTPELVARLDFIQGTWRKPCGPTSSEFEDEHFDIIEFTVDGDNLTLDIRNFNDPDCSLPFAMSPRATSTAIIRARNSVTTVEGDAVTKVDYHLRTFNGAPFLEEEYQIVMVDGDTLKLGNDRGYWDGTRPERRPESINHTRVFERAR